ncbi:phytanoyl-CoA dioxygenase family protein [Rhodopila sp.]|uniref:phytanoyl-CoA dioxygenase family protein n=1 Tax=Rhodopila sp. TaxID=2480087 RepID=UPI003D0B9441
MRLDAEKIRRFENEGFLSFETGLSPRQVDEMRGILTRLHNENIGFNEGALFDAMGVDDGAEPKRFPQILHPRSFAPELLESDFFHLARGIAEQLLGDQVRFKADISLMKPAHIGEATPWHQDEAFHDPNFDYREVSFWLALQPTDTTNSCMAYIPGSQKGPVLPHGFPGGDNRIHALDCASSLDVRDAVGCPLSPGGCVIHSQRTVHGAGPNVSDRDRLAYVLIFDLVPTPARVARNFPWRAQQQTARAQRELRWRRRGGLVIHLWRQRTQLRLTNMRALLFDARRALKATLRICLAGRHARGRFRSP